jgi:hypothetical protein
LKNLRTGKTTDSDSVTNFFRNYKITSKFETQNCSSKFGYAVFLLAKVSAITLATATRGTLTNYLPWPPWA